MFRSIDTLADLIEESKNCQDKDYKPDDVLYRFVSANRPPYDIGNCEKKPPVY
ncbi:hypothetical protein V5J35_000901 [Endozoicomonas sp. NE40]|uniref:Uncharacterized protein n=1 Tax=Endozoicomonas lisbonensis TaxID=3120522 RepID=A0ABV2SD69_9GAMM